MKIIHAVRSDGFAGVERHVAVLATAQLSAGHRVAVIGGDPDSMRRELPTGTPWAPASSTTQVGRALLRWRGADVVHAHMTAAEVAAVLTTPLSTPVVVTRHFGGRRGHSPAGRMMAPLIRRRASAQIAISRYVAARVDGRATVVYPGVASPRMVPGETREPWILAAQRLEAEKGVDVVIRAFARSGSAQQGWRLAVAGDGTLRRELELLATREGVGHDVDFLGHRDDMDALMRRASIFMSGCAIEGLGLAVVEAMSEGLPVVTTAAGGHAETVGLCGDDFLFSPGDVEEAGNALRRLTQDSVLRDAYGSALRELQRDHFTPERQEQDTLRVYERVIKA